MARRQVSIFINGKPVVNQIKSITDEKRKLTRELGKMVVGSKAYNKQLGEIGKLDTVIQKHRGRLKGVETGWKSLTTGAVKFLGIAGLAFGASEIIQYGKELFRSGIQMDAMARKADTVLGPSLHEATEAAKEHATAMGLTRMEYVGAVTDIADFLKPMGFTTEEAAAQAIEMQNLAGALSEWSNGQFSATEVSGSFRKALVGEREELERYGISIKQSDVNTRLAEQGLKGLTGQAKKQAEAMATLQLITESSKDAQTAYSEGSESAVRRQAELSAKIKDISERLATLLLPVFERLTGLVNLGTGVLETFIEGLESISGSSSRAAAGVAKLQGVVNTEIETLRRGNLEQENRERLIKSINKKTRGYTEAVLSLSTSEEELAKFQKEVNLNFNKRIQLLAAEDRLKEVAERQQAAIAKQLELEKELTRAQERRAGGNVETFFRGDASLVINSAIEGNKTLQKELRKEFDTTVAAAVKAGVDISKALSGGDEKDTNDKKLKGGTDNKELKALEKKRLKLLEVIKKFKEEERLAELSAEERKIAELEIKFNEQIEIAKGLEEKAVTGATELRLELERLKQERVDNLKTELLNASFLKEQEQLSEQEVERNLKELERKEAKQEAEQKLNAEIQEVVFSEQQLEQLALEEHFNSLFALAELHGIDTFDLEVIKNKKLEEINDKHRKRTLDSDLALFNAQKNLQLAKLNLFGEISSQLANIAGENSALQTGFFLFEKALAAATIIIELQKQIAAINTKYSFIPFAGPALAAAEITRAKISAGTGLAAIAGTVVQQFTQKKEGGFHTVRGQTDGNRYSVLPIGQPMTGLLDYPHPVLVGGSSPVIANELGREYYVSHSDLRKPAVLQHVQAIENLKSYRQRAGGGFNENTSSSLPIAGPAPVETTNNFRMEGLLELNIVLLQQLLAEGVKVQLDDNTLIALNKRMDELNTASGGRVFN